MPVHTTWIHSLSPSFPSLYLSLSPTPPPPSLSSTYTQPSDPQYAGQAKVYHDIGKEMLQHAFEG